VKADDLLERAQRSHDSAKLLFNAGDINGACNRAYYAMFDAARAALSRSERPPAAEAIRTHSGLISAFSMQLIRTNRLPIELGKSLSKVAEIRLIADYSDEEVAREDAAWVLDQAALFVEAIRTFLRQPNPRN
jgi:uncharacterized protein (UPF0332 family)